MTTFQKIAALGPGWIAACGVIAINMDLSLSPFSNTRSENLAILAGGTLIWAGLSIAVYKMMPHLEVRWVKGR